MRPERKHILPALQELLTSGGDERIALNAQGVNKYGCFPTPQPDILAYGSCTASTISPAGFAATMQLYERLPHTGYAGEMHRIRRELITLLGLDRMPGLDMVFSASGTDLHRFVAQLLCNKHSSLLVIMPDASETGSGVPAALQGDKIQVMATQSRVPDGSLRAAEAADAEVEAWVVKAVAAGKHVLLILTDLSKTGLITPSPACVFALKHRFPDKLDILVDACQFRLSPANLRHYLEQECLLAMTGSKFITGPAFSAALLMPRRLLPALPAADNIGLLLRWEAALAECRAFYALPEIDIRAFAGRFAATVQQRLADDPVFEPLPVRALSRPYDAWDGLPTIFPFRLRHPSGALLTKEEITMVYEQLRAQRCHLGQPVACGALRLCLDMRLITDALSPQGHRGDAVIAGAMAVLDKAAALVRTPS